MSTIAIIGAGQLGSRHLQSLAALPESQDIWVVDAAAQSLEVAATRWAQMPGHGHHRTRYVQSVEELPTQIDVCIVATGAGPRAALVNALAAHAQVRYLVLEKVLFQTTADYDAISALLASQGIPAWVNCPRRMYPFYKDLKQQMQGWPAGPVNMEVSAGQMGLGCNGVHFLDLYAFLSGDSRLTALPAQQLDPHVIPSKRAGAVEFTGTLTFEGSEGGRVTLTSIHDGTEPTTIVVEQQDCKATVTEPAGSARIRTGSGEQDISFQVPFQSALTSMVVASLLETGDCELTPYEESRQLHLALAGPLLEHYNQYEGKPGNQLLPTT